MKLSLAMPTQGVETECPPPPRFLARLFDAFEQAGLGWFCWKSSSRLAVAFEGRGDLDLLSDRCDRRAAVGILTRCGFKHAPDAFRRDDPATSHGQISDRPRRPIYSLLFAVWAVALALDKRHKLNLIQRAARRRFIVITDRGPALIEYRRNCLKQLSFAGSRTVSIDAGSPLDLVTRMIRRAVWDIL
jgi:hypothetical protein